MGNALRGLSPASLDEGVTCTALRLPGDHFLVHELGAREVDLGGGLLPRPRLHRLCGRVHTSLHRQRRRRRGGQPLQRTPHLLLRRLLLLLLLLLLQARGDAHAARRRQRGALLLLLGLLLHGRAVLLLRLLLQGLLHGWLLSGAGRCAVLLLRGLLRRHACRRRPILLWQRCAAAGVAAGHAQRRSAPSERNDSAWASRWAAQRAAGRVAELLAR